MESKDTFEVIDVVECRAVGLQMLLEEYRGRKVDVHLIHTAVENVKDPGVWYNIYTGCLIVHPRRY